MVEEEINATTTTTAATTPPVIHVGADITEEERESLQERLEAQLRHKKKVIGMADGEVGVTDGNAAIWETCCQLTSQLSADLAEQLRYCADSRVVRPVVVPTSTPYRPTDSRTHALTHSRHSHTFQAYLGAQYQHQARGRVPVGQAVRSWNDQTPCSPRCHDPRVSPLLRLTMHFRNL